MTNANTHVRFHLDSKNLIEDILKTVDVGDYIFLSGKPLWRRVKKGIVLERTPRGYKVKDRAEKQAKLDATTYGIRVDKQNVFCPEEHTGVVGKYKLNIYPYTKAVVHETVTPTPEVDFLKAVQPGDYVMVWSRPDYDHPEFMHYPVQGWCWNKDEEKGTLSFIHPPRMDIQVFDMNNSTQTAMGYYRKLVLRLEKE